MNFLGVQWCGPCQDLPSKDRCIWPLLQPKQRRKAQGASLDLGGNVLLTWLCYSSPFTEWPKKPLVLRGAQNKRRLCSSAAPGGYASCSALGLMIQQIQWCRKHRQQTVCSSEPLAAPRGESQQRLLGCRSKALPSPADNYLPSEKQLLVCCWALAETWLWATKLPCDLSCPSWNGVIFIRPTKP